MAKIHIHTKYSLLDAIIEPEQLVKKVKEQDGDNAALCVTEHGNIYSDVEIYKYCKKYGVKYMLGCEAYICNDVNIKDKNNRYYHLVVIAKNEQGRLNLNKLVSESCKYKYYGKPRIDFEMLCKYKEGLIVLSACMAGEVQRGIMRGKIQKVRETILKYKNEFGEDYYLEYQSHSNKEQQKLNAYIVGLAKKYNIKYVVTTDAHYLNKDDQKYHNIFVQIGQTREVGETYNDCYVQSNEEILEICQSTSKEDNLKALATSDEIAAKCNVELPLSPPIMPHVPIPDDCENEFEYLKKLCAKGWIAKKIHQKPNRDEYKERLIYELRAIKKMGFEGYFLLVDSYCNSVKRRGIARGSAGGSLVCYLSNITDIDPIEFGLYFERFIDVGALKLLEDGSITPNELKIPDVDSDFGKKDREKVLQFVIEQYGKEKVVSLGTFQYIWAKGAIKDIGRVLNIPFDITNSMTKNLDQETIQEALDLGLLDDYIDEYPELFDYVKRLAGLPKSFSAHACGKVIAMNDVTYYNATDINKDGLVILQGDMHTAEDLGLIKADFLGLRTVDVIYDTLDMIGKDYEYIAPHNIDFNDAKVLSNFRDGHTAGIFQFESGGMQDTLKKIECNSIFDLTVANALYRPGSMKYIDNYANRRKGTEKYSFLHEDLEPILKDSYGIIIFQEQLIEIGRLAKLSNPDELRKATGKKDIKKMEKVKPELFEGLSKRGWNNEQLETLWDIMVDFARYSFNKSHAAAYAIIAYICMYLKTYHPKEFICAWFNSITEKPDKIPECVSEINRLRIPLYLGKYNDCSSWCRVYKDGVMVGTKTIKFCNAELADGLKELSKYKYDNFIDLLDKNAELKLIDSRPMGIVIALDFFSDFGETNYLINVAKYYKKFAKRKQFNKGKLQDYGIEEDVIKKYSEKETEMLYKDIDIRGLVEELAREKSKKSVSIVDRFKFEMEYLGYIRYKEPTMSETRYIVIKFEIFKDKSRPYFTVRRIWDGKEIKLKMKNGKIFPRNKFKQWSILDIKKIDKKNKYKFVDGKWKKLNEFEPALSAYEVYGQDE